MSKTFLPLVSHRYLRVEATMNTIHSFSPSSVIQHGSVDVPATLQEWSERLAETVEQALHFVLTTQDWDVSRVQEYAYIIHDRLSVMDVYEVVLDELAERKNALEKPVERRCVLFRISQLFRNLGMQNVDCMQQQRSFWQGRKRMLWDVTRKARIRFAGWSRQQWKEKRKKGSLPIMNPHDGSTISLPFPRYTQAQLKLYGTMTQDNRSALCKSSSQGVPTNRNGEDSNDGISAPLISSTVAATSHHQVGTTSRASLELRQKVPVPKNRRNKGRKNMSKNTLKMIKTETRNRLRKKLEIKTQADNGSHLDQQWIANNLIVCGVCSKFQKKAASTSTFCKTCLWHVCSFCDCSVQHPDDLVQNCPDIVQELPPAKKNKKKKRNKTKMNHNRVDDSSIIDIDSSESTTACVNTSRLEESRTSETVDLLLIEECRQTESSRSFEGTDIRDNEPVDLLALLIESESVIALANYIDWQEREGLDLDLGYNPARDFPWECVIWDVNT